MKLMMILYSGSRPQHVRDLISRHAAGGFTEIDGVHGAGKSGRLEGSRAWPGTGSVFLSALTDDGAAALGAATVEWARHPEPGEHVHVATLPIEQFF